MRTRVLPLGTAFVLRTTMPVQADRPVADHPAYLQFPTDLQRRHPSPMLGSVDIHLRAKNAPTRWMAAAKLMSVLS